MRKSETLIHYSPLEQTPRYDQFHVAVQQEIRRVGKSNPQSPSYLSLFQKIPYIKIKQEKN